jgi:excinuclease ABC subunit B
LDFETAARLRDEIKRLKQTELAVLDNPTARDVAIAQDPKLRRAVKASPGRSPQGVGRPHKPHLDEMGIALYHEVKPARSGKRPSKPSLDDMGPGVESVPAKRGPSLEGGRSTMGRPGMHGGFKANKRKR